MLDNPHAVSHKTEGATVPGTPTTPTPFGNPLNIPNLNTNVGVSSACPSTSTTGGAEAGNIHLFLGQRPLVVIGSGNLTYRVALNRAGFAAPS